MRLNLGKNNLDDIPTDAFHPLINLEVLDLHENRIRHIPDNAFQGEKQHYFSHHLYFSSFLSYEVKLDMFYLANFHIV